MGARSGLRAAVSIHPTGSKINAHTVSMTRYQQISLAIAVPRRASTCAREGGTMTSSGASASRARGIVVTSVSLVLVVHPPARALEDREDDDSGDQDQDPRQPRRISKAVIAESLPPHVHQVEGQGATGPSHGAAETIHRLQTLEGLPPAQHPHHQP